MDQLRINFTRYHTIGGLGQRSLYGDSLRSRDRIPVGAGGHIFRNRPGPASHPYNVHRISFPEVKRQWSGAAVQERVKVYLYYPFRPSCPVLVEL